MILSKDTILHFPEWLSIAENAGAFALIDKELLWTSFDVIAKLRKVTGIKKIGHSGTLDPRATGLLILAFGKATKRLNEFQNLDKTYNATIKIGATTKSYDGEYEEENIKAVTNIDFQTIQDTVYSFIGAIQQVPPMFSAKQFKGKRLYKLARKNENIEISPKKVTINSINILDFDLPFINMNIECSTGTYIRSLAKDIGDKLSIGAYLYQLRRLKIGDFHVENALKIEDFLCLYNY